VEKKYRTVPFRALAGHSFGGLFALHTLLVRPELFQARIVAAATYSWEGDALARKTAELLAARPTLGGALVFTIGEEPPGVVASFRRLEATLAAAKPARLRWKAIRYPEDDHGSLVLPTHHDALRFVFAGWDMPIAQDAVGPKGGLRAVEAHFAALSERLGFQVAIPENVLNLAGYQALADGDAPGALRGAAPCVAERARQPGRGAREGGRPGEREEELRPRVGARRGRQGPEHGPLQGQLRARDREARRAAGGALPLSGGDAGAPRGPRPAAARVAVTSPWASTARAPRRWDRR